VKILAFTDRRYAKATRKVTGWDADIVACPPFMAADIEPFWLESYDFLYLDLHGLKCEPGRHSCLCYKLLLAGNTVHRSVLGLWRNVRGQWGG
jgi:hypothetical protein